MAACDSTVSSGARGATEAFFSQSSSTVPRPGESVFSRVPACWMSATTASPVDGRKALDGADDPRRDLLALDLEGDDPARSGLGRHPRRCEDGQREPVGRLSRAERAGAVGREHVAEARRLAADAAGAEPA